MGGLFGRKARASASSSAGEWESLGGDLDRRVAESPDDLATFEALVEHFGERGDRLVEYLRRDERLGLALGRAYQRLGRNTLAVVALRKVAAAKPSRTVYLELARVYEQLNKPNDARAAAKAADELPA